MIKFNSTNEERAKFVDTLPKGSTVHVVGDSLRFTVPNDGFEKLIAYVVKMGSWIHSDYKPVTKKRKARNA